MLSAPPPVFAAISDPGFERVKTILKIVSLKVEFVRPQFYSFLCQYFYPHTLLLVMLSGCGG